MKIYKTRSIISLVGLICFLILYVGSDDESSSGSSESSSGSSESSSSSSESSSSSSKTYHCGYCGDSYEGRGYTTAMRVVNRVKDEDSPFNSYCSSSCAQDCIRVECFTW